MDKKENEGSNASKQEPTIEGDLALRVLNKEITLLEALREAYRFGAKSVNVVSCGHD